jgi:predicted dinucleotide-utilizing enzyme
MVYVITLNLHVTVSDITLPYITHYNVVSDPFYNDNMHRIAVRVSIFQESFGLRL